MSVSWIEGKNVVVQIHKNKYLCRTVYRVEQEMCASYRFNRVKPYVLIGSKYKKDYKTRSELCERTKKIQETRLSLSKLDLGNDEMENLVPSSTEDRIYCYELSGEEKQISEEETDVSEVEKKKSKRDEGESQKCNSEEVVTIETQTVMSSRNIRELPVIPVKPLVDENLKNLDQPTYNTINESIKAWVNEVSTYYYPNRIGN